MSGSALILHVMRAGERKLKGIHLLSEVQVGASAETWSAGRSGCRGESGGVGVEVRSLELVVVEGEAQSRDVAERPYGVVRECDRGERSPCVGWAGCGGGASRSRWQPRVNGGRRSWHCQCSHFTND